MIGVETMGKTVVLGELKTLAICRDRWYKVGYYIKRLVPWAREKGYLTALSDPQKRAISGFTEVATKTAGVERWQRREIIGDVLRGASYGGVKRPARAPRLTEAEVKARKSALSGVPAAYAKMGGWDAIEAAMAIVRGR